MHPSVTACACPPPTPTPRRPFCRRLSHCSLSTHFLPLHHHHNHHQRTAVASSIQDATPPERQSPYLSLLRPDKKHELKQTGRVDPRWRTMAGRSPARRRHFRETHLG